MALRSQLKSHPNLFVTKLRAADTLDADDGLQAGVLTGAGGTFSAGMDLKAFLRGERPESRGRDRDGAESEDVPAVRAGAVATG